jgi:hypothetical protein
MKKFLLISIVLLAGRVACGQNSAIPSLSPTPPGRARTLDLRALTKQKGSKPQSLLSFDTCQDLYTGGLAFTDEGEWQESYDTLKLFIERCANYNYPDADDAFGSLSSDVQNFLNSNYSYDSTIYAQYRVWLYSVLYLNTTDPGYFCACLGQIFNCFSYVKNDTSNAQRIMSGNIEVAFNRWLLQNTSCDSDYEWTTWQILRKQQLQLWQQDSIAGVHYPYDTTIPTLGQIGYGIDTLLAKHALAIVPNQPISIITNATASPNPVSTGTVITFGISQEAYVKINLFDLLGAPVSGGRVPGSGGEGFEGLFAPGNHEVPLSLQGLPSGTYFARILTAYGSVSTIKLVKEQ